MSENEETSFFDRVQIPEIRNFETRSYPSQPYRIGVGSLRKVSYPEIMEGTEEKVILFDGICGLCNAWVDFVLRRDRANTFKFATLQGAFAQSRVPLAAESLDSVVLISGDRTFYKSSAALRILAGLGGLWTLVSALLVIPPFLRNAIYDLIAANRYRLFGKRETCRVPTKEEKDSFLD